MTLAELLDGHSVFIDANIFIYHFGGHSPQCKAFLERCARRELLGYTSTPVLAEVLHRQYLASGMSQQEILDDFPYLTEEDIRACLAYAADREKRQFILAVCNCSSARSSFRSQENPVLRLILHPQ
jgi:hypothetical protein